jgi:hypothetical protein
MRIEKLPAAAGRRWALDGFRLLRRYPLPLLSLTLLYLLLLMVTTIVPVVGPFAPMLLTPLLAVGMMHAMRSADRGEQPASRMLFSALREDSGRAWKPLLVLGVINVVSTVLSLAIAALADGGTLLRLATGLETGDDPALHDLSLLWASLVFVLLYTPVQMALWYAPYFVAWHHTGPAKALFFSIVAVMRNKWAFTQYALSWLGVALVASILVQVLKGLFDAAPLLISMVLSPLSLVVLSALYCSFWATYRDAVLPE